MEQTFLAGVRGALAAGGDRQDLTFLTDGEIDRAVTWSFADLDLAARTVAGDLRGQGVKPGDRMLLLRLPGKHFQMGSMAVSTQGPSRCPRTSRARSWESGAQSGSPGCGRTRVRSRR